MRSLTSAVPCRSKEALHTSCYGLSSARSIRKPRSADVKNGWIVRDGLLVNETPGNDLLTEQKFTDFQVHAEFRYSKGSNSGIYLRGRYEDAGTEFLRRPGSCAPGRQYPDA